MGSRRAFGAQRAPAGRRYRAVLAPAIRMQLLASRHWATTSPVAPAFTVLIRRQKGRDLGKAFKH